MPGLRRRAGQTTTRGNVGYLHFEELFGQRNSVLRKSGATSSPSTRPSPTSTTARSAAAATAGSRSSSPPRRACDLRLHHHLLPVPGTGRERNIVYDAGDVIECLQRAGVHLVLSGHKHVPYAWRLENLFVVNTGTVSLAPPRKHEALLQRDRGLRLARLDLAQASFPRPGTDHPVLDGHLRVREVHGPDRGRGDHPVTPRALAVIDGEH